MEKDRMAFRCWRHRLAVVLCEWRVAAFYWVKSEEGRDVWCSVFVSFIWVMLFIYKNIAWWFLLESQVTPKSEIIFPTFRKKYISTFEKRNIGPENLYRAISNPNWPYIIQYSVIFTVLYSSNSIIHLWNAVIYLYTHKREHKKRKRKRGGRLGTITSWNIN